ncbi:MAG: hypothetical protein ACRCZI_04740, partial [Cetobacterium sp.]
KSNKKKYSSKESKTIPKKESSLQRRIREKKEKEQLETKKQKELEKAEEKEESRKHKIIYKYMENLEKKLTDKFGKHNQGYWFWNDNPKEKIFNKSITEFQNIVNKTPDKYKGKQLIDVTFIPYHNKRHEKHIFKSQDTWLSCVIKVYTTNDKNQMKVANSCNWTWRTDDFKLSKFSFKLLNFLIKVIAAGTYTCGQLSGEPLSFMVKNMKKRGVDFGDLLQPLANV